MNLLLTTISQCVSGSSCVNLNCSAMKWRLNWDDELGKLARANWNTKLIPCNIFHELKKRSSPLLDNWSNFLMWAPENFRCLQWDSSPWPLRYRCRPVEDTWKLPGAHMSQLLKLSSKCEGNFLFFSKCLFIYSFTLWTLTLLSALTLLTVLILLITNTTTCKIN